MKILNKGSLLDHVSKHRIQLSSATLLAVLVGCLSIQVSAALLSPIKVYFTGACPTAVDNFVLSANKGDQIQWQASNQDGTANQEQFQVHFDPFRGADISTNPTGLTVPPQTIDSDVPANVLYKYTITATPNDPNDPNDPAAACAPLDPFLRVY